MNILTEIYTVYLDKCKHKSDINEHLQVLKELAEECEIIAELGVRNVVSSWAFAAGLLKNNSTRKILWQNDIEKSNDVHNFLEIARAHNINAVFKEGNDLNVDIPCIFDMVFIDTWHIYGQLIRELERYKNKSRKYIVMHDTTVDGIYGEEIRMGYAHYLISQNRLESEYPLRQGLSIENGYFENFHKNIEPDLKFLKENYMKDYLENKSKMNEMTVDDLTTGLWKAVEEFLDKNDDWELMKRYTNNNGLTILKRKNNIIQEI
tara:strand:- start:429 stop:1217 length:789 start_codon:yes stop_codon:yes gene_type:complete